MLHLGIVHLHVPVPGETDWWSLPQNVFRNACFLRATSEVISFVSYNPLCV